MAISKKTIFSLASVILFVSNLVVYVVYLNPNTSFLFVTVDSNASLPATLLSLTTTTSSENCGDNSSSCSPQLIVVAAAMTTTPLDDNDEKFQRTLKSSNDTTVVNNDEHNATSNSSKSSLPSLLSSSTPLHAPPTLKPSNVTTLTTKSAKVPPSTFPPPPVPRMDVHNYSYLINEPYTCGSRDHNNNNPLLVILVCTSLSNAEARTAIRETWGSVVKNATSGVKLVFLLGSTPNETLMLDVRKESEFHRDIIQENFLDTYNNLTLKSVMMLKWVHGHCSSSKFVLRADDDMFVNVPNLIRYLNVVRKRRRMLFGRLVRGARPVRSKTNKWFTPTSVYKERVYPDYLSGTSYAMSGDVASMLYNVSMRIPLFYLEDVFITGMCARKVGIPRRHHSGFTYETRPVIGCAFRSAITGHRIKPSDMRKIWSELNKPNLTCKVKRRRR